MQASISPTTKKNKQFGVSNQKAEAYTFVYNVNNYENNNSVRYDLCSTDDQQALSIGEEGALCWAAPNTRNSAVDLRPYIIAPELPIPSLGGADYHSIASVLIRRPLCLPHGGCY